MQVTFSSEKLIDIKKPVLILPVYQKEKFSGQIASLDKKLGGFISEIIIEGYFNPELGQVHAIYTHKPPGYKKLVLVGLGKRDEMGEAKLYQAIASAISYVGKTKVQECAVYLAEQSLKMLQNIAEIAILSLYQGQLHKTEKQTSALTDLTFVIDSQHSKEDLKAAANLAKIIAESIHFARDLANQPSNIVTPKKLAKEAGYLAKGPINVEVFGEEDLKKMRMDLLLSVARGSDEEAQLIILDYKPTKFKKTIALVGKGLTFDTGGVSLKPSEAMSGMNLDMSGAAAVVATFYALSRLTPRNIRVIGAIPATENMMSGRAQKPGDIWKSYGGKTVEVLDTDAEGRLVLADALAYVQEKYRPDYLVDIATLTGACLVALGHEYAGLFGNNETFIKQLYKLSLESYEKLWPMPINDAFKEEMKGDNADLKNIGYGRKGGACTAAAFLDYFVNEKRPWAHLDIAGPAHLDKATSYLPKGGTGFGAKTLIGLILDLEK